jgi:hypothetical protein
VLETQAGTGPVFAFALPGFRPGGFAFLEFDPESAVLVIDDSNVRLQQVLIGSHFLVDEEVVVAYLDALDAVPGDLLLVAAELQLEFAFEQCYLAEVGVQDAALVVPSFEVKVFGRVLHLNRVYEAVDERVGGLVADVEFLHEEGEELKEGRLDVEGDRVDVEDEVAEVEPVGLAGVQ